MSDEENEWDGIVEQLLELTRAGQIPWSFFRPGTRIDSPEADVRGMVYEGSYIGRTLFVYEYEYKHWLDEDRAITETDVAIDLLAKHGHSTWRLPETEMRHLLLDEVRKRTAEADDFAQAFRKEKKT
jgi:hypothetical protein